MVTEAADEDEEDSRHDAIAHRLKQDLVSSEYGSDILCEGELSI